MTDNQQNSSIFHDFSSEKSQMFFSLKSFFVFIIVIVLAIGTGYFISKKQTDSMTVNVVQGAVGKNAMKGTIVGSSDTATFKDTAEGILQKGGINGEGQYHLVRKGGDSQNVYLTSSIVDLSQFIGEKILVNGQTQKAKYAGWLMDVGRVEVTQ